MIIRGENSNLKKAINNLEKQIQELNKKISEKSKLISKLENKNKNLNVKMDKIQKQNEILNSNNINNLILEIDTSLDSLEHFSKNYSILNIKKIIVL